MAVEDGARSNAIDTMLPILPGNRHTGIDCGLETTASGGRRHCLRCVVGHIRKGMRDEKARGAPGRSWIAGNTNMWSRGGSTGHLVNLAQEWARTGIIEISSLAPSLPLASQSRPHSLSSVGTDYGRMKDGQSPFTCTQSLVVLGDDESVPLLYKEERSQDSVPGSWFLA